jgi:hypothetical protein
MQYVVATVVVAIALAGQATGLNLPKVSALSLVELSRAFSQLGRPRVKGQGDEPYRLYHPCDWTSALTRLLL